MIRAARPNEIALLPQIEDAADERYARVGLRRILAYAAGQHRLARTGSARRQAVGRDLAASIASWASRS